MMEKMGRLNDVGGAYRTQKGGRLLDLVEMVESLPIRVPADGSYLIEQRDGTIHVYREERGIDTYMLEEHSQLRPSIVADSESTTITFGRASTVVLHHRPLEVTVARATASRTRRGTRRTAPGSGGESRTPATDGESHSSSRSGESRTCSRGGESRSTGSESHNYSDGGESHSSSGGGESR